MLAHGQGMLALLMPRWGQTVKMELRWANIGPKMGQDAAKLGQDEAQMVQDGAYVGSYVAMARERKHLNELGRSWK